MRLTRLLFFVLSVPSLCFAQSKELLSRIALNHKAKKLSYEQKNDSVILLSKYLNDNRTYDPYDIYGLVAKAYLEKGNKTIGLKYVRLTIEHQGYHDVGNMKYNLKKYKLDSLKEYQNIIAGFDKLFNQYTSSLNFSALNTCQEIFYTDMRIRNIWMYTNDSVKRAYTDINMYYNDSVNAVALTKLMQKIGYFPGVRELGPSFVSMFNYSVKHYAYLMNRDTLYYYLRVSTLSGDLPNYFGPSVFDKMEYDVKRPLIYGAYGNSGDYSEDGTYNFEPIKDIEYADKRRAEFLLPPLYKEKELQKCKMPLGYDPATQKN